MNVLIEVTTADGFVWRSTTIEAEEDEVQRMEHELADIPGLAGFNINVTGNSRVFFNPEHIAAIKITTPGVPR